MTAFYMFRLLFLTFFGEERLTHEAKHHLHESPPSMTVPLMILAMLSVVGGLGRRADRRRAGTASRRGSRRRSAPASVAQPTPRPAPRPSAGGHRARDRRS